MPKSKILNVRIEPDLKKMAKKLAEKDGRTLSNWVTRLIQHEVQDALANSPETFRVADDKAAKGSGEKKGRK
jgi:hypothetical protein